MGNGAEDRGLPVGTVTLLFTDIEGSTRILQSLGPLYAELLAGHRRILERCITSHGGRVVDSQGDSFFASFALATEAAEAAAEAQLSLAAAAWPGGVELRVRMGMHTGEPARFGEAYVGIDVHKAARIGAAAHGGQILLSEATASIVGPRLGTGLSLRELGEHFLKDIARPQRLYELQVEGLRRDFPPPRAGGSTARRLPSPLSSFVGRERERAELARCIRERRLVTLAGPGGTGKTRLSLVVVRELLEAEAFRDGASFVELGAIADPGLVAVAVASSLELAPDSHSPVEERLADYLRPKELLLVLDNCEHLVEACASLAAALLREAPGLRVLATSRESLGVEGELVWRLPSLAVPGPGIEGALSISLFESVRLFLDRARSVQAAFVLDDANAAAVGEICRRLDGIPLAIELAASRTKLLSAEQISRRIDDRFRLLAGGSRSALPRQQTLRALVDWSHELLSERERIMLRRLSVFAGGWTVEAAEAVCGAGGELDVLEALTGLVDKSLVATEGSDAGLRHRLLETIRDYARERLLASEEAEALRDAHMRYFLGLAQAIDQRLRGSEQRYWLLVLDRERDNLRSALEWSNEGKDPAAQLALAASLWRYWRMRSDFCEGRRWLELALLRNPDAPAPERARCLLRAGSLANYQGDYRSAGPLLEESLELHRSVGKSRELADAQILLANTLMMRGNLSRAGSLLRDSLSICEFLGDARGIAYACFSLASLLMASSGLAEARSLLERSRELLRGLGDDWWIASTEVQLAWIMNREGDHEGALAALALVQETERGLEDKRGAARATLYTAEALADSGRSGPSAEAYREALAALAAIGDQWWIAVCIEGIARVRAEGGEAQACAMLLGAAQRIHEESGAPVLPSYLGALRGSEARAEALAGAEAVAGWREAGRSLSLEAAIALALGSSRP